MKLLKSDQSKITKNENGKNFLHLEIIEVVLVHYNVVDNGYQFDLRVLYMFVPIKPFGQLLVISSKNIIIVKLFDP